MAATGGEQEDREITLDQITCGFLAAGRPRTGRSVEGSSKVERVGDSGPRERVRGRRAMTVAIPDNDRDREKGIRTARGRAHQYGRFPSCRELREYGMGGKDT